MVVFCRPEVWQMDGWTMTVSAREGPDSYVLEKGYGSAVIKNGRIKFAVGFYDKSYEIEHLGRKMFKVWSAATELWKKMRASRGTFTKEDDLYQCLGNYIRLTKLDIESLSHPFQLSELDWVHLFSDKGKPHLVYLWNMMVEMRRWTPEKHHFFSDRIRGIILTILGLVSLLAKKGRIFSVKHPIYRVRYNVENNLPRVPLELLFLTFEHMCLACA